MSKRAKGNKGLPLLVNLGGKHPTWQVRYDVQDTGDGIEFSYTNTDHEPTLKEIRSIITEGIIDIHESEVVKEFFLKDESVWLSESERLGLNFVLKAEHEEGIANSTIFMGNKEFELPIAEALKIIRSVAIYSKEAYLCMKKKIKEVEGMTDIDKILHLDLRNGYPKKLRYE